MLASPSRNLILSSHTAKLLVKNRIRCASPNLPTSIIDSSSRLVPCQMGLLKILIMYVSELWNYDDYIFSYSILMCYIFRKRSPLVKIQRSGRDISWRSTTLIQMKQGRFGVLDLMRQAQIS